jgi:hypothetical protein
MRDIWRAWLDPQYGNINVARVMVPEEIYDDCLAHTGTTSRFGSSLGDAVDSARMAFDIWPEPVPKGN